MAVAGTMKMLTAGNIGSKCGAVHQVLGRPALKTPVDGHSMLIQEHPASAAQATVKLPSTNDDTSCRIQYTLEPVSGGHWRLGQHGVMVVTSQHEM